MLYFQILERMKEKERDWIDAQDQMNKIWREQNDKFMAKSLDHQANAMKTHDAKWIKAKQLIQQFETMFDERQTKFLEGRCDDEGPHVLMTYPEDKDLHQDVAELILHHVNRQSIPSKERDRIKYVLRRYIPEWFFISSSLPTLSDDEDEDRPIGQGIENNEDVKLVGTARTRLIYGGNSLMAFLRIHHVSSDTD